jgi:flagellar biosynthesis/type III secretory pathway protein FliH
MAFDPQLQRALEAAGERFRAELARETQTIVEELQASAAADRERALADLRSALERDAAERLAAKVAEVEAAARRAGFDDGRREGIGIGRQEGLQEGQADGIKQGIKEGFDAGTAEGRAAGLAAGQAEIETARAEGRAEGIERGKAEGLADGRREAVHGIQVAVTQAAAATRASVEAAERAARERLLDAVRSIAAARTLSDVFDRLAAGAAREVPGAAVFLVDGSQTRPWRDHTVKMPAAGLEVIQGGVRVTRSDHDALPITVGGQVVAILGARSSLRGVVLEVLARHAGRCLEAITAFKTARLLTAYPEGDAAGSRAGESPAIVDDLVGARRYARLLVSEIKLYHEADVAAGQRLRDLSTRLGGEIARARALYEQRVPHQTRETGDVFHDELVRTLANGDASLLQAIPN